MSMTQQEINVDLFDEVKKLQRENELLRDVVKKAERAILGAHGAFLPGQLRDYVQAQAKLKNDNYETPKTF
jgi:hypothetical protein